MYERASWLYQTRIGLSATSAAPIRPVRVDASSRPSRKAAGIISVPISAESERNPTSPRPKGCAQSQASA